MCQDRHTATDSVGLTDMTPEEALAKIREVIGEPAVDSPSDLDPEELTAIPTTTLYFDCTLAMKCSRSLGVVQGLRLTVHEKKPATVSFVAGCAEGLIGELEGHPTDQVTGEGNRGRTSWEFGGHKMSVEVSEATNDQPVFELDLDF
jgi:hypothetical protein